jgi:isopenicillin N synthase-like dioxygenase
MTPLPVLDISGLAATDPAARRATAEHLGAACREAGFFLATGHRIPDALRDGLFDAARAFFALPEARKEEISIRHSPHNRGYVALAEEQLDPSRPAARGPEGGVQHRARPGGR